MVPPIEPWRINPPALGTDRRRWTGCETGAAAAAAQAVKADEMSDAFAYLMGITSEMKLSGTVTSIC